MSGTPARTDAGAVYAWLMSPADPDGFCRHVLACGLAAANAENGVSLSQATGLGWDDLARLVAAEFSHAASLLDDASPATDGGRPATIEEPDLRALLLANASPQAGPVTAERLEWLARLIARRAQCANHLWQDLGLPRRKDLSRLMAEFFAPLAQANDRDMKWKKFFYRRMCEDEGMSLCKSPVCDSCDDFIDCFSGEDGHALLARNARDPKNGPQE